MRYRLRTLQTALASGVLLMGMTCLGLSAFFTLAGFFPSWTPMIMLAVAAVALVALSLPLIVLIR